MDPKQCLLSAESALREFDKLTASTHLANYAAWRARGGFEPDAITPQYIGDKTIRTGDEFHGMLMALYRITFNEEPY